MTGEINRMTQSMNAFDKEINNAYEEEAKYIQNISVSLNTRNKKNKPPNVHAGIRN